MFDNIGNYKKVLITSAFFQRRERDANRTPNTIFDILEWFINNCL
jgi:hypothetical protein